jgi:hypothetical protein
MYIAPPARAPRRRSRSSGTSAPRGPSRGRAGLFLLTPAAVGDRERGVCVAGAVATWVMGRSVACEHGWPHSGSCCATYIVASEGGRTGRVFDHAVRPHRGWTYAPAEARDAAPGFIPGCQLCLFSWSNAPPFAIPPLWNSPPRHGARSRSAPCSRWGGCWSRPACPPAPSPCASSGTPACRPAKAPPCRPAPARARASRAWTSRSARSRPCPRS